MRSLAIVAGGIALLACALARVHADEVTSDVPRAQLASMGLAGLQPMSDAAGHQVRGTRAAFGGWGAIGIPLNSAGDARLVVPLNWTYHAGSPDVSAVILRHLLEAGKDVELIPPGRREL
jgi:hypothetical protein